MLVNLNDVLKDAKAKKYAVGLFNAVNTEMLQGVIEAAEETKSPVIIGTAEVLLKYGELKLIAPSMIEAAKRASVPVVLHYDHGLTFERCMEALKCGFTSIMYDGSLHDYDTNIANTAEIVKICHSMGASVEGEIGHVGNAEGGEEAETEGEDRYTTVKEAVDYYEATKVDALAIAIGTAHGAYKTKPVLNLTRLAEIRKAVDLPLVLHGGSGLTDDDFKNTIAGGISKVNIFTDLLIASEKAAASGIAAKKFYLDTRNDIVNAVKAEAMKKMRLFGSEGRA